MRRATALALALLAIPAAARDRDGDRDPLAGRVAGPPQDCVSLDRVQGPDVVDERAIIYRQNRSRWWVTRPVDACPGLRRAPSTLIVDVQGSRICRNDRFRVKAPDSIIPGPVCRYGAFTPYDLPSKPRGVSGR